jgi:hypothetical protein
MNSLLSKALSSLNVILAIAIILGSSLLGFLGEGLINSYQEFSFSNDLDRARLELFANTTYVGGIFGLVIGLIMATYICGVIATLIRIKVELKKANKNQARLYKLLKENKEEI